MVKKRKSSIQHSSCISLSVPTLVLDSGGWTIKHGIVQSPKQDLDTRKISLQANTLDRISPNYIPNVTAKPNHQLTTLVGDEINTVKNKAQLHFSRPLERGFLTDLGTQFRIWGRVLEIEGMMCSRNFSGGGIEGVLGNISVGEKKKMKMSGRNISNYRDNNHSNNETSWTHSCSVLLLHQPFTPRNVLEREDEVWFRDFGFSKVGRQLSACCAAFRYLLLLEKHESDECRKEMDAKSREGIDISIFPESSATEVVPVKSQENTNGVIDDRTGCCCVIDSGFSLTHVVPTYNGRAIEKAIRRINIGGKLLTNLLKENISYRQWNMMDEFSIVNEAKEALCFISTNFIKDIKDANFIQQGKRWFDREFVLPNFLDTFTGSVRLPPFLQQKDTLSTCEKCEEHDSHNIEISCSIDNRKMKAQKLRENIEMRRTPNHDSVVETVEDSDDETEGQKRQRLLEQREEENKRREQEKEEQQTLSLSIERFAVPEALFRPSDIGLDQVGVAEAIVESINACDPIYHAAMYHNILLIGGNIKIPHFKERLELELRSLAPENYIVRVYMPDDVLSYAWNGAQDMLLLDRLKSLDREEWEASRKAGKDTGEIWDSLYKEDSKDGFILI